MLEKEQVFLKLKSGARLHIQALDPTGISGYMLGGLGLALKEPQVEIIITTLDSIDDKNFILDTKYISEIKQEQKLENELNDINIFIKSEIPAHTGLGSGTLYRTIIREGLRKILESKNINFKTASLTGVGYFAVLNGGMVLVTPRIKNVGEPRLIQKFNIPKKWQVILCIPKSDAIKGLSGKDEIDFYTNLAPPKVEELHTISFEILTKLIPAINTENFDDFSNAMKTLTSLGWKIPERELFREYWDKTSTALYEVGAKFVGTTSSGPTAYTIVNINACNVNELKKSLENKLKGYCNIIVSEVNNSGLRIEKD